MSDTKPVRQPVNYRYDALNWEFIKLLAENAHLAAQKYKSVEQYTNGRLEGEKSPINHIYEHLRSYIAREPHDAFEGDIKRHLAAIAYNAMMEFFYLSHGGPTVTDAFVGGSYLDYEEDLKHQDEDGARNVSMTERILSQEALNALNGAKLQAAPVIDDAPALRRHASPFPPRLTVVQEPNKTKFVKLPPEEDPTKEARSILTRLFSSNKAA